MAVQDIVRIVLSSQPAHVRVGNTLRTLRRLPLIPVSLLLLLVVTGIFAPLIAPHDPNPRLATGPSLTSGVGEGG